MNKTFTFLVLTYNNFVCMDVMKDFIGNNNLLIHPKYYDKLNNYMLEHSLPKEEIINTKWGSLSIIEATIKLFDYAINKKKFDTDFYILLSEDSYPLFNFTKFKEKFSKINPKNMSCFEFIEKIKIGNNIYYKTSQWNILNKKDVKIILDSKNKYINHFNKIENNSFNGAYDEIYILSVLMMENNNYKYINHKIMYTKWLKNCIMLSPTIFNKLLLTDINEIKRSESLFIRKVGKSFRLEEYKPKKSLYVILIGEYTNIDDINLLIKLNFNKFDFIIITTKKKNIINDNILQIYNVFWKSFNDVILNLSNSDLIKNWDIVIFTTERFNINNYNYFEKCNNNKIKGNLILSKNDKINYKNNINYYYIRDNNNNIAYCLKNNK